VFRYCEITNYDLLARVSRFEPPERQVEVLDQWEIERLIDVFGDDTYEDVRNRAFVAMLACTGARPMEIGNLRADDISPTGYLTIHGKGDRIRYGQLSERALRLFKQYLRRRPQRKSPALWLTEEGRPLSYRALASVMTRLKRRSGIERYHAHLLRHSYATRAIRAGAERAKVQDILGHATDYMTRRYSREARKETAAQAMPEYSPI
jgi:site-specific recombinase XerD